MNLKESLESNLAKKELRSLKKSFDVVGDIAILEIPPELEKREKLIAEKLIELHKNIKTVCKKAGDRSGTYRLRRYKKILGDGFETIHKESGCRFKIDIRKAYFSVRESAERLIISQQVKPKEKILVLFSGVGPFGIVIGKSRRGSKIEMVEINPAACRYAEENIKLNKLVGSVKNYCGNIKKIHPSLGKYDRIVMPLPETAHKFLDIAIQHCKKSGVIYLYSIVGEQDSEIENHLKKFREIRILNKRNVLPYAPGVWKACFELERI